MAATEPCSHCRWYESNGVQPIKHGVCRRYPPNIVLFGSALTAVWPTVNAGDWCGEHWAVEEAETPRAKPKAKK